LFHQRTSHQPSSSSPASVLTLADYGWDAERECSFAPSRAAGLVPGRVVRAERGLCDVVAETGPVRAAVVPGTDARVADTASSATVVEVLKRRTAVVRSTASRTSQAQVLAANVDTVAVRLDGCHRLQRENAHAASRTDARLRRAIKQSPHFMA